MKEREKKELAKNESENREFKNNGSAERESSDRGQSGTRVTKGLNRRITTALILLMAVMAVFITCISVNSIQNIYYTQYSEKAQELTRMLAHELDGDWVRDFSETLDENDPEYVKVKNMLNQIKTDFSGIQYLYIYKPGDTSFTYLVEGQSDADDASVIAKPGDVYEYLDRDYDILVPDIKAERASTGIVYGQDAGYGKPVCAWAPLFDSNGKMVAMVEADFIVEDLGRRIRGGIMAIVGVQLMSMLFVVVLMILYIRRIVIRPLGDLTDTVDSYQSGRIKTDVSKFKTDDEITSLAYSFSDMTIRIEQYIKDLTAVTAEKERIGAELNVATKIQASMLPSVFPAFPERDEFDIFASMTPAKEVGGDFYDFFLIDEDHLALVIADVSGKGVPAALFMMMSKILIANNVMMGVSPGKALEQVNDQICKNNEEDMFVTVWLGILEISTGHVIAANAGHEYPFIQKPGEKFEIFKDKHDFIVGGMEGMSYHDYEFTIEPGGAVFVYTDGAPEATSADQELFGTERMIQAINKDPQADAKGLIRQMKEGVDGFVGSAPQFDDLTMLAIRYKGTKNDEG